MFDICGVLVGIIVCEDIWKDGLVEGVVVVGVKLILNLNVFFYDIDK